MHQPSAFSRNMFIGKSIYLKRQVFKKTDDAFRRETILTSFLLEFYNNCSKSGFPKKDHHYRKCHFFFVRFLTFFVFIKNDPWAKRSSQPLQSIFGFLACLVQTPTERSASAFLRRRGPTNARGSNGPT